MIQYLLDGAYDGVELHHVRLAFSRTMAEIGHPSLAKIGHLCSTVVRLTYIRLRRGTTVLYYPPAGPDRVPMYRDLVILLSTRWMFRTTIFHFHAGGLYRLYPDLPAWLKWAFRRAYYDADVGVRSSTLAPDDPTMMCARRDVVAALGAPDAAAQRHPPRTAVPRAHTRAPTPSRILFVGVLRESKGVLVLVDACAQLRLRGIPFEADLVGEFSSEDFERRARELVASHGLDEVLHFRGPMMADDKYRAYAAADVFCLPSFFEAETFGVVLIEAMQFGLPIVATNWSGIPAVVTDGVNGYLVPVRDATAIADRLETLLTHPELAAAMGARARQVYETHYTLAAFHRRMQELFDSLQPAGRP